MATKAKVCNKKTLAQLDFEDIPRKLDLALQIESLFESFLDGTKKQENIEQEVFSFQKKHQTSTYLNEHIHAVQITDKAVELLRSVSHLSPLLPNRSRPRGVKEP